MLGQGKNSRGTGGHGQGVRIIIEREIPGPWIVISKNEGRSKARCESGSILFFRFPSTLLTSLEYQVN